MCNLRPIRVSIASLQCLRHRLSLNFFILGTNASIPPPNEALSTKMETSLKNHRRQRPSDIRSLVCYSSKPIHLQLLEPGSITVAFWIQARHAL